jgi:hypothetical protein
MKPTARPTIRPARQARGSALKLVLLPTPAVKITLSVRIGSKMID